MFSSGHAPEGHRVAKAVGISKLKPQTGGNREGRRRSPRLGDRRRGQCLVEPLASRASSSHCSSSPPSPPSPGRRRLKRDPLVLDKVTFVGAPVLHPKNPVHSFTPNGDCRYDRIRIQLPGHPLRPRHRPGRQARRRLVVTLARDRFLKRYHFHTFYWDGRQRGRRHRPPGPLQAAGQAARARNGRWYRPARSVCTGPAPPPRTAAGRARGRTG